MVNDSIEPEHCSAREDSLDSPLVLPRQIATAGPKCGKGREFGCNVATRTAPDNWNLIMQRPTSVTVFGVLNIVFGVLGLLGIAVNALSVFAAGDAANVQANPILQLQQQQPVFAAYIKLSVALGFVAVIVLFVAGIGLLNMRAWARKASIGYAIYSVVSTILGIVLMAWFFMPLFQDFESKTGAEKPVLIGAAIGGIIGACLGPIYPVLLWYFMTRRHVVAAIDGVSPHSSAGEPLETPARELSDNPYLSPMTQLDSQVMGAPPGAVESVVETFIPSKNGPALAAYYLGLFSLFPCLGFPLGVAAVYYGVRGLRKVRETPAVRGGIHAWVGIICGGLFGLLNFVFLVLVIIGGVVQATKR